MLRSAAPPRAGRIRANWIRLWSLRGKRKPRPLVTIGVWAVDTSEEAPPQSNQPPTARRSLSSPSPERVAHRQQCFPSASRMRFVQERVQRVSKLRAWSALLRSALSPASPTTQLPRLQPPLPAMFRWTTASCSTPGSISETPRRSSTKSDGSLSCVPFIFWQSRLRETK